MLPHEFYAQAVARAASARNASMSAIPALASSAMLSSAFIVDTNSILYSIIQQVAPHIQLHQSKPVRPLSVTYLIFNIFLYY